MAEILEINNDNVKVGTDDENITTVPIGSVRFANPQIGQEVKIYKDENGLILKNVNSNQSVVANNDDRRKINKIVYILITFFLGALGVHRFMRGQVGLGILMLLIGWWATFGIWPLVDFIISLVKLSAYKGDDYVFTPDGRFTQ